MGLKSLVCLVRGHCWKFSSDTYLDSTGRLGGFSDSDGRPYKFECRRCKCPGRIPFHIEACSEGGPFRTPHVTSYMRYRAAGFDRFTAILFSFPDWTTRERDHLRKCTKRMQVEDLGNAGRVKLVIKDEEERTLEVFNEIEKHVDQVINRMGLSVETLQTLWESRGWDPELVCMELGKEEWFRTVWQERNR